VKVLLQSLLVKYIGIEIGYIEKDIGLKWKNELDEIMKMIKGLKKFIKEHYGK